MVTSGGKKCKHPDLNKAKWEHAFLYPCTSCWCSENKKPPLGPLFVLGSLGNQSCDSGEAASLFPWIPAVWSHLFTQQGNKNRSGDYPIRDVQRSSLVSRESPGFLEGVKLSHIQSKTLSPLLLFFQVPLNRGKKQSWDPRQRRGSAASVPWEPSCRVLTGTVNTQVSAFTSSLLELLGLCPLFPHSAPPEKLT